MPHVVTHFVPSHPPARSTTSRARRAATVLTGVTLAASGLAVASPAVAAATCSVTPVKVATTSAGDIYQVTVTSTTACDWTPPTGFTQLEAVLVGGGGGAATANAGAYGGGGGEVLLRDLGGLTGPITVQVGTGGAIDSAGAPSILTVAGSTVIARPGSEGYHGDGMSGNGYFGADFAGSASGGGAGGPGTMANGGPGVSPGSLASASSLFAGFTSCYGGGGAVQPSFLAAGTATCGGGTSTTQAVANSGGGGGGIADQDVTAPDVFPGAAGVAVFRYAVPAAASSTSIPYPTTLRTVVDGPRNDVVTPGVNAAWTSTVTTWNAAGQLVVTYTTKPGFVFPNGSTTFRATLTDVNTQSIRYQVDTYRFTTAAQARRVAALDDDGVLRYREDRFMWGRNNWQIVTIQVPASSTIAQRIAAINAASTVGKVVTTNRIAALSATGKVTIAWRLGVGATAAAPWGTSKAANQTFAARSV